MKNGPYFANHRISGEGTQAYLGRCAAPADEMRGRQITSRMPCRIFDGSCFAPTSRALMTIMDAHYSASSPATST